MPECRQCGQWEIKKSDDYCSYCGRLQLDLSADPLDMVFITNIVTERNIIFTNNGPKDLMVDILPSNHSFDWLTFLPNHSFIVVSKHSTGIKVLLEENKLPKDLLDEELKFLCMVDSNKRKMIELSVQVKTGPNPVALPYEIRFGDVEEGRDIESWIEIINKGGVPLLFNHMTIEGSNQFEIRLTEPVETLLPNAKMKIPVLWKAPMYDPDFQSKNVGLKITFKNYSKNLFIPFTGRIYKFQLEFDPVEINIPEALSKQIYSQKVILTNNGTKDIEIIAIESDQEWIQIIRSAEQVTLLCKDRISPKIADNITVFPQSYSFDVMLCPGKLEMGIHTGKIRVKTKKATIYAEINVQMNVIHPRMCNDYIGIDFGTSNSVVAIWDDYESDIRLVEDQIGSTEKSTPLIPSVLVFHGKPDYYKIGIEAENSWEAYPDSSVRSIKRIMGYGNDRVFYGQKFSPEDLAALIIKKLVEHAETRLYEINKGKGGAYLDIRKAIITVPSNFYDLQIRGILKACEKAGLDIDGKFSKETAEKLKEAFEHDINSGIILDEPSAAALFFLSKLQEEEQYQKGFQDKFENSQDINFLIFDHGGGTLDVSVVKLIKLKGGDTGIKVLANKGDNRIGGDSIDILIMKELLKRCKAKGQFTGFDDSIISMNFNELENRRLKEKWDKYELRSGGSVWGAVLRARGNWKKTVEKLKISLDNEKVAEFKIGTNDIFSIINGKLIPCGEPFIEKISSDQVLGWIEKILMKCKELIMQSLNLSDVKPENIDYVIHTGRTSLMPCVQKSVQNLFTHLSNDRVILDKENIKVCVAKGAALYGLMRQGITTDSTVRLISGGRRLPHSYGIQVMKKTKPMFEPIIALGTEYPTEGNRHFDEVPGQRILNIKFYQNAGLNNQIKLKDKKNPDIRQIGSITVDTLEEGMPGCDVKFMIDANRKMVVSADGKTVDIDPIRFEDEDRWVG